MLLFASQSSGSRRRRRGWFVSLWRMLTWPFRTVERIETAVIDSFRRRRQRLRHKYRHSKVIAPLVGVLVWIVLAPLRLAWYLLTAPFRLIGNASERVQTVRRKRNVLHFLQGLPAAVGLFGVFVVLLLLTLQAEDLVVTYRQQAQTAYDGGHYERAQLYLQRVLQLGEDTNETSYLLARTLEKTGHPNRSVAILDSLAPELERGYPPAHLWKAAYLISDPETLDSPARLRALQRHLKIAEEEMQDDPDVDYYLGQFYLAINDRERAAAHYERASATRLDLHFDLAMIYKQLERPSAAAENLALARPHYEQQLRQRPDDERLRLTLSEILLELEDYDAVYRTLQEGITLQPDGPYKRAMALAFVRRYDVLPADADPGVRIALLQQALAFDPHCMAAFNRLMYFGDGGRSDPAATKAARDVLESLIAVGESAPLAHFALGVKAWQQQDSEDAIWHLERAYKLDPSLAVLGNNLAWMLAHDQQSPDLPRALGLINSVLEIRPDTAAYLETRGQILLKMERWDEALEDLERALPTYQRNADLHDSLALVYAKIGQQGLADKHTRVADNLRRFADD